MSGEEREERERGERRRKTFEPRMTANDRK